MHKKTSKHFDVLGYKFADERARGYGHVIVLDVCHDSLNVHCTGEVLSYGNVVQCATNETTKF